jgi:hypothetical protein
LPTITELNQEQMSWIIDNATGAFNSPLKWTAAGSRISSNGSLVNVSVRGCYWSSIVSGPNSDAFVFLINSNTMLGGSGRANGSSVRCIKETVGALGALNCGGSTTAGNLFSGSVASNVSVSVSYTGGNAGSYSAQSVSSTGVTGLTATLAAGTLANGAGH